MQGFVKCLLTCSAANQAEVRVMRRGEDDAERVTLQTIQSQFVEVGDVIFLREDEQVENCPPLPSTVFPFKIS